MGELAKKYQHLNKLANEIVAKYAGIRDKWTTSLDDAIRIGDLLTQCKMKVEHGDWLPWVAENLPFKNATASNFIRAYGRRTELKSLSNSDLLEGGWQDALNRMGEKSQKKQPVTPSKATESEVIDAEEIVPLKQLLSKPVSKMTKEYVEEEESPVASFSIKSLMAKAGEGDNMMDPVWDVFDAKIKKALEEKLPSARITEMIDGKSGNLTSFTNIDVSLKIKFTSMEK